MQSASRMIKRGNAVIAFDEVTKQNEFVAKRGTSKKIWAWAVKNEMKLTEHEYRESITDPLTHEMVEKSTKRNITNNLKKNGRN